MNAPAVPEGATIIEPAGTAPGMIVPPMDGSGPTVVVLPGPPRELHAMWEQAMATSAGTRSSAPAAIASATWGETAPHTSISWAGTPSRATFASFAYATAPPATYAEAPGGSVSRAPISPPVQDSAVATFQPLLISRSATCRSTVEPSVEKSVAE